ncbi:hypothetical protein GW17_00048354 [Ensete ventricosum]|nr:hypothetical protein GW17_00048354 [Ensete ventricosum]
MSRIRGVPLQRSIVWIPLERRTLDLLHRLHSDLKIQGYTISLVKAMRRRGGQPRASPMQGRPWPCKGGGRQATAMASPQGAAAARRGHNRLQRGARKEGRLQDARKGLLPATSPLPARTMMSTVGVAAPWQSSYRWTRAAAAGVGVVVTAAAQRGQEGLEHPLKKRMILPL